MPTAAPTVPRTRRGERTRESIIQAAVEEFAAVGFVQARVEAITARAGVGYGTFYQYFPSKQALLSHLAETAYREMRIPPDTDETRQRETLESRVYRHLYYFLDKYSSNARIFRVIDDSMTYDPEVSDRIWEIQRRQATAYAAGMLRHEGEYQPVGEDRLGVAQVIGSMCYEVGRRFVRLHDDLTPTAEHELKSLAKVMTVMVLAAVNPAYAGIKPRLLRRILNFE